MMLSPSDGRFECGWKSLRAAMLVIGAGALPAAGGVVSWGANSVGQSSPPLGIGRIVEVTGGWDHSTARLADGSVVCWGLDNHGELQVPADLTATTQVSAGWDHSVALHSTGTVTCWGAGKAGQSGFPHYGQSIVPEGLAGVMQVAGGGYHTLALRADGSIVAWGLDSYGQSTPPSGTYTQCAAGNRHSLAIRVNGSVACWGESGSGQCTVPEGMSAAVELVGAGDASMARLIDGTVRCWGYSDYGQLNIPADLTGVVDIAGGAQHMVALREDGALVVWGTNSFGQMTVPASANGAVAIGSGAFHSMAIICPTTIRVPQDAASIDEAVAMVCAGTPAEVTVGAGAWTMSLATASGIDVTIRGAGQSQTTITESAGGELLNAANGARVLLRDLTVADSANYPDLAFNIAFDNCTVRDCTGSFVMNVASVGDHWVTNSTFLRCRSESFGILYGPPGTIGCTFTDCKRPIISWGTGPGIVNCTFTGSVDRAIEVRGVSLIGGCSFATSAGHAVLFTIDNVPGQSLSIVNSSFTGNVNALGNGAAIHVGSEQGDYYSTGPLSSTTLTNCTFTNNSAQSGGAIYAKMNQPLTMSGCTFTTNVANAGGGGAVSQEFEGWSQSLTATSCNFIGNKSLGDNSGGAIKTAGWDGQTTLTNCQFTGNTARSGGAIGTDRQVLNVLGCSFSNNSSGATGWGSGGAIATFITGGEVRDCVFNGNTAHGSRGGALWFYWSTTTAIISCDFTDNTAGQWGGAMHLEHSAPPITGCAFTGNVCGEGGSCIGVGGSSGVAQISNCVFRAQSTNPNGVHAIDAGLPVHLSGNTFCASGETPWSGPVQQTGPNCIVASCADSDNNGTPDECQSVTVPGDYKSVQLAIDATPVGEFRLVSLGSGTFAGPISFGGRNVVVRGAGAGQTIIDGTGGVTTSVVGFTGGEPASSALEGVTIRGGLTGTPLPSLPSALVGGGVFALNSAASLRNCVIELNEAGFGAGIYCRYSTGSIENCIVRNNRASSDGGGIQIYGGSVGVIGSFVESNYANGRGGGLHLVEGTPSLTQSSVRNNFSNNLAGGLSWVPGGDAQAHLEIVGSEVKDNTAAKHKGGIAIVPNGAIATSLSSTVVCANSPAPNISGPWENVEGNEVCECLGDIIVDGMVGPGDLAVLLGAWGTADLPTGAADVNHDGVVDGGDLVWVLVNWGTCLP